MRRGMANRLVFGARTCAEGYTSDVRITLLNAFRRAATRYNVQATTIFGEDHAAESRINARIVLNFRKPNTNFLPRPIAMRWSWTPAVAENDLSRLVVSHPFKF